MNGTTYLPPLRVAWSEARGGHFRARLFIAFHVSRLRTNHGESERFLELNKTDREMTSWWMESGLAKEDIPATAVRELSGKRILYPFRWV